MATIVTSGNLLSTLAGTLTLTESSENSMLPAENAINGRPGKRWQTGTSTSSENVVIDFGSSQTATRFGYLAPTGVVQTTALKIQGNATDSWSTPTVDETISDTVTTVSGTLRYWRFLMTKFSSGTAAEHSALVLSGSATFPTMDFDGFSVDSIDRTSTLIADGGSFSDSRDSYLRLSLPFTDISNSEKNTIDAHWNTYGSHTPFYLQPDSTDFTTWYYVKFADAPRFENTGHDGSNLIWSVTLTFNEEINP